jgi:hypothetical protein
MTPPKASAPPADALQKAARIAWFKDKGSATGKEFDAFNAGYLAASAQAREVEACVICCADEPYTGTCGSSDPRALCNKPAAEPVPVVITDEMVDKWHRLDNELRKTRFYADEPAYEYDRERLHRWMEAIK